MLPDRVSNPGPLTYESGALPIALRGPADTYADVRLDCSHMPDGKFPIDATISRGNLYHNDVWLEDQQLHLKAQILGKPCLTNTSIAFTKSWVYT